MAFTDRQLVTIATNISFLGPKRKYLGIIPSLSAKFLGCDCRRNLPWGPHILLKSPPRWLVMSRM
jgi:hypothetical protein